VQGAVDAEVPHQGGVLTSVPDLPTIDVQSTADYIRRVLDGTRPVPLPIEMQVQQIIKLTQQCVAAPSE